MPSLFSRHIGLQLAAALILASVAPLLGAGFLASRLIEDTLLRQSESTRDSLLDASGSLVDGHVAGAEASLTTIARMIVVEEFANPRKVGREDARVKEELAKRLLGLLEPSDVLLGLAYHGTGTPGENDPEDPYEVRAQAVQSRYNSYQQELPQVDQNLRNGFAVPGSNEAPRIPLADPVVSVPRAGKSYVSESIQFAGPIPYIRMSVPVRTEAGVIGVLVASVNLEPMRETLNRLAAGRAALTVRDADGTVVAAGTTDPGADALESRTLPGARGWTLSIREPRGAALGTLAAARRQAWLWTAAAVLLALVITFVVTARLMSPVRALSGAVEKMARGDLRARAGVERQDELGRLAQAFDGMAAALEKLDQLKSDFVSHASHELRTPLTSMKLSIANLQDGVIGPLDGRQQEVLARVRGDLDRLIRMVNELLDAARLEAGRVELSRERCDLGAIARGAVETVRPIADEKGVRLEVEAGAAPLDGDRMKLHEVVLNVVDNAVKFTPAGGRVHVAVTGDGDGVACVVTDGGPGIPTEKLARVFEKFAMIPGDGAPKPPGAGLGLSISRKIMELHGGSIRVDNLPGGGARFRIALPGPRPSGGPRSA
ncbi:MAG: sensor histidine kinase [Candidatus Brocadiae bacterium]|nr:sensor histidine kinase [Candidatus Brocadiia bacterium]